MGSGEDEPEVPPPSGSPHSCSTTAVPPPTIAANATTSASVRSRRRLGGRAVDGPRVPWAVPAPVVSYGGPTAVDAVRPPVGGYGVPVGVCAPVCAPVCVAGPAYAGPECAVAPVRVGPVRPSGSYRVCCVGTYACAAFGRLPSAASASICSASAAPGRVAGSLRSRALITGVSGPAFRGSAASSSTTACMVPSGEVRRKGERPSTAV